MKTLELTDEEFEVLVIVMKRNCEHVTRIEGGFRTFAIIQFVEKALVPFDGLMRKVAELSNQDTT